MTVSDILDIDSFDDEWTNDDYNVPMMVDAQQVMAEVSPDHAANASGGEPLSESEESDGETEGDNSQSEEDAEEDQDEEEDKRSIRYALFILLNLNMLGLKTQHRDSTLARLEDIVLDLLKQLSEALPDVLPNEHAKQGGNSGSRNRSGPKRLMIRLADRRKPVQADGYERLRTRIFCVLLTDQILAEVMAPAV